jgi:hypothetical protein
VALREKPGVLTPGIRRSRQDSATHHCTLITAVPVVPPELAVIVLVPAAMQFASPATLGALAMVATLAEDELQCAFSVTSCVLASLNVPVATNC